MRQHGRPLLLVLVMILATGVSAMALTADEILDQMNAEADALAQGGMVSTIRFENAYDDGTTAANLFGSLSKPGYTLIYFIEPADVQGTIFLTHEAQGENGSARLWLYLPLLGIPKELVSDEERGGSFAGSSLSYEDLGDETRRADYDATLIREETLTIDGQALDSYVIESVAKEDADVATTRTLLWVEKNDFVMLKMEGYNDLGNLESTMNVVKLGRFEGKITADALLAEDLEAGSSTTVTFEDRHRPAEPIPTDLFAPENLPAFDPAAWGF